MFAWFRRFTCFHPTFTQWHLVERKLYSMSLGTTIDEVQRRECMTCGHVQQREIEEVK